MSHFEQSKQKNLDKQGEAYNSGVMEARDRIANLAKHILAVSGGIQAFTISAFLTGKASNIPLQAISTLKLSWLLLAVSIICCLLVMLIQLFGLMHVNRQLKKKIDDESTHREFIEPHWFFDYSGIIVGISAFGCCVSGVFLLARAAIQIIA